MLLGIVFIFCSLIVDDRFRLTCTMSSIPALERANRRFTGDVININFQMQLVETSVQFCLRNANPLAIGSTVDNSE